MDLGQPGRSDGGFGDLTVAVAHHHVDLRTPGERSVDDVVMAGVRWQELSDHQAASGPIGEAVPVRAHDAAWAPAVEAPAAGSPAGTGAEDAVAATRASKAVSPACWRRHACDQSRNPSVASTRYTA